MVAEKLRGQVRGFLIRMFVTAEIWVLLLGLGVLAERVRAFLARGGFRINMRLYALFLAGGAQFVLEGHSRLLIFQNEILRGKRIFHVERIVFKAGHGGLVVNRRFIVSTVLLQMKVIPRIQSSQGPLVHRIPSGLLVGDYGVTFCVRVESEVADLSDVGLVLGVEGAV